MPRPYQPKNEDVDPPALLGHDPQAQARLLDDDEVREMLASQADTDDVVVEEHGEIDARSE